MAAGLVAYDTIYLFLATLLYGSAGFVAARAFDVMARWMPGPFAVIPAALVFLVSLVVLVGVFTAALPRLSAGSHPLMKGRVFWSWLLRSALRRVLYFPPLRTLLFTSNLLRWASLRALGARVAFAANMSSDVDLLDPALTRIGAGTTVGTRCLLSAHYIKDGQLVLAPISVGAGTLLGAQVVVAPGVTVGRDCLILGRVALSLNVTVEDGVTVGGASAVDAGLTLPAGARYGFAQVIRREERR
jgi:hypothetical protein